MLSVPDDFMALYIIHLCTEGKYFTNHNTELEKRGRSFAANRQQVQRNLVPINFLLVSDVLNVASHPVFTTPELVGHKLCKSRL